MDCTGKHWPLISILPGHALIQAWTSTLPWFSEPTHKLVLPATTWSVKNRAIIHEPGELNPQNLKINLKAPITKSVIK